MVDPLFLFPVDPLKGLEAEPARCKSQQSASGADTAAILDTHATGPLWAEHALCPAAAAFSMLLCRLCALDALPTARGVYELEQQRGTRSRSNEKLI